jgi:2'-5' RNA ligase
LFVAVNLPGWAVRTLVRWRDGALSGVPGVRPLALEAIHVTLCFLGWRSSGEMTAIADACGVLRGMTAPELSVTGPVWLPPRRPRVLAVELGDDGGRLARAQGAASDVLAAGGWYRAEKRPYLPHVTVARLSAAPRASVRRGLAAPPDSRFRAPGATLYRSRLLRSGARYEELATFEFSG